MQALGVGSTAWQYDEMPNVPNASPWSDAAAPDLLKQASALLAREASRIPTFPWGMPTGDPSAGVPGLPNVESMLDNPSGRLLPGAEGHRAARAPDAGRLLQQAHELIAGLLRTLGQGPTAGAVPVAGGALPGAPIDKDRLRMQAHELIEALLVTFGQATSEKPAPYEDNVPIVRCVAPVHAGQDAHAIVQVTNEDSSPAEVSLYCTNFVADAGYEIPSLRISVSPRRATIASKAQATFDVKVAVSPQTPAGFYSGLIQAMGSKYVKAVLSLEVI